MEDATIARILYTLLCFGSFIIIVFFAYKKSSKTNYDEAANQLFADDDTPHMEDQGMSGIHDHDHGAK